MALARDRIVLTADVVGGAVTTLVVVTGLNFNVQTGYRYHFKACLVVTGTATSGVGTAISASPTTGATLFAAEVMGGGQAVGAIDGGYTATYAATGAALGAAGTITVTGDIIAAGSLIKMEGIVVPAATQVLQLEFQNESGTATTVKAGSYLEWELLATS